MQITVRGDDGLPVSSRALTIRNLGIASDGGVITKETEHFPSCVRPSRIGVGAGGIAARPSVASSVDTPLLEHCPPVGIRMDSAGIGMAIRHSPAIALSFASLRLAWNRR